MNSIVLKSKDFNNNIEKNVVPYDIPILDKSIISTLSLMSIKSV